MHKIFTLFLLTLSLLGADMITVASPLNQLNDFKYETPQGRQMKVPKSTELVVIAFEKDTGALVNEFLDTQDPFYMPKRRAIFIADINKMPTIITNMFALPKLKKYKHLIYLHYEDQFQNALPHKEEQITLLRVKDAKIESIAYVSTQEELKAAIEK
jgi:hypothetical protein